jgi:hypothetical protein
MMMIARRSSRMASAVRNILSETGTREPRRASTPRAKAMSVAVGMAQPRIFSPSPMFKATKIRPGMTMPPAAAMPGSTRRGHVESWPIQQLTLHLQADEQEEHSHQGIVDPVEDAEAENIGLECAEVGGCQR